MAATERLPLAKLLSSLSLSSPSASSSSPPPSLQLPLHPDCWRCACAPLGSEKLRLPPAPVEAADMASVLHPVLTSANILFFRSVYYTVQVVPEDNEPGERLVSRFRREVVKAGVLQECKRRRFFETKREAAKRKIREAAKKYRKRRRQPESSKRAKEQTPKKKTGNGNGYGDGDDDNWELPEEDFEIPYCSKLR